MKQALIITLFLLMTVLLFTACGGDDTGNSGANSPKWGADYPSVTDVTGTTLNVNVMLNERSTVYFQVLLATDPEPTKETMRAGEFMTIEVIDANTKYHSLVEELSASTDYTVYLIAYDLDDDIPTNIEKIDVTTTSDKLNTVLL